MKMPDKIYIQEGLPGVYGINQQGGIKGMHAYIRKDALLEWAKVYKEEADALARGKTDNLSWGERVAMKNLINKINEL